MVSATSPAARFSGLSAIGQIAITVADVDRAVAYYRDILGMNLLFQFPGLGFFDCGGVRLMLTKPENPGEGYSSTVYFRVPDVQQAHAALAARGVAFEREPHLTARMADHDLWMAFFRDLDGNLLALMCEVPRA
ncbi:MAG TPA: VOC family protein [Bryobacteraceae bacterium]|nr:VOC family protein [Bryobacteraceae bacterium]